jgi:hypothetical protein
VTGPKSHRACRAGYLAIIVAVLTACSTGPAGFTLRNDTDADVVVSQRFERTFPVEIAHVGSLQSVFVDDVLTTASDCTTGVLVARTASEGEIARLELPLCNGQTWVIKR